MDTVSHNPKGLGPQWTKLCKHKVDNKVKKVLAGTCALDGLWGWMKKGLHGVKAQHRKHIESHVREFQWMHWNRVQDRWKMVADVLKNADPD